MIRNTFLLFICFFICFQPHATAATEYPWERDARATGQEKSPTDTAEKKAETLRFGPFDVELVQGWKYLDHNDQGEALMAIDESTGTLVTVISLRDKLKFSDRKALEKSIIKQMNYQKQTTVALAGKKDVLCLSDASGSQSSFYLFPYTGDTMYVLTIAYEGERQYLSRDTWSMLKSFRFAD